MVKEFLMMAMHHSELNKQKFNIPFLSIIWYRNWTHVCTSSLCSCLWWPFKCGSWKLWNKNKWQVGTDIACEELNSLRWEKECPQTLLALYEFFLWKVREAGHQYMWFLQVSAPLQKPISISRSNPVLWLFRKCIEQPKRSFAVGKIWNSGCCRTIGSFEGCSCSSSEELEIGCCGENRGQILVNWWILENLLTLCAIKYWW